MEHRKYAIPVGRTAGCEPAIQITKNTACNCSMPSLAMVYPPYQKFDCLFSPCDALVKGTLFNELNKPFYGTCDGNGLRKGEW